jgi:hypothetical protein
MFGNRLLDLRPSIDHSLSGMNISKITQILDERKKAADEAAKIQAVFDALDKICSEHGFESYAGFLKKVSALEAPDESGDDEVERPRSKREQKSLGGTRMLITQELVEKMKEAYENKGEDDTRKSIAARVGVKPGTIDRYRKLNWVFAPKKKGRKEKGT